MSPRISRWPECSPSVRRSPLRRPPPPILRRQFHRRCRRDADRLGSRWRGSLQPLGPAGRPLASYPVRHRRHRPPVEPAPTSCGTGLPPAAPPDASVLDSSGPYLPATSKLSEQGQQSMYSLADDRTRPNPRRLDYLQGAHGLWHEGMGRMDQTNSGSRCQGPRPHPGRIFPQARWTSCPIRRRLLAPRHQRRRRVGERALDSADARAVFWSTRASSSDSISRWATRNEVRITPLPLISTSPRSSSTNIR